MMLSRPDARDVVDAETFKRALGHFASGVTIITSQDDHGLAHGMTATAFTSVSLAPPLILVAVSLKTRCHALVSASRRFGVSVLSEKQADVSRHYGGRPASNVTHRFEPLAGIPVVADALVTLACDLDKATEAGDHTIFIGLVTAAATATGHPLLHFNGQYRSLSPLS